MIKHAFSRAIQSFGLLATKIPLAVQSPTKGPRSAVTWVGRNEPNRSQEPRIFPHLPLFGNSRGKRPQALWLIQARQASYKSADRAATAEAGFSSP